MIRKKVDRFKQFGCDCFMDHVKSLPDNCWCLCCDFRELLSTLVVLFVLSNGDELLAQNISEIIPLRLVPAQDGLFAIILWYVAKSIFRS